MGLSHRLGTNSSHTEIRLAYNTISNEGAIWMGTALKMNSTLLKLDLGNCSILKWGCMKLCQFGLGGTRAPRQ